MLFLFKEVNPIVYSALLASNQTRNQNIKKSYGSLISGQKKNNSIKEKKKKVNKIQNASDRIYQMTKYNSGNKKENNWAACLIQTNSGIVMKIKKSKVYTIYI